MQTRQVVVHRVDQIPDAVDSLGLDGAHLVLAFGAVEYFEVPALAEALRRSFPGAAIAGCSTAGEISTDRVYDWCCAMTAVRFDHSRVRQSTTRLHGMYDSFDAGFRLAAGLPRESLAGAFVLAPGVDVNGSALVDGIRAALGPDVPLAGGLAADAGMFRRTWTLGDGGIADDQVVGIGLYGERLRVSSVAFGGWAPFGPARKVTRCHDNVLHELDGERALDIYKRYLGEFSRDLPASGLLFPFEMLTPDLQSTGTIRSILGVNDAEGTLTLAGAVDQAGYLRLMQASTERLIEGAATAATRLSAAAVQPCGRSLAILVSCVGRKLVMGDRVDEEVEVVVETLGADTEVTGFYSNGEISAAASGGDCCLQNQTMAVSRVCED